MSDITFVQKVIQSELFEKIILEKLRSLLYYTSNNQTLDDMKYFIRLIQDYFTHIRKKLNESSNRIENHENELEIMTNLILKRNYQGPISFKRLLILSQTAANKTKMEEISKYYWGGIVLEFLNLIDGKLSIEEIFLLLRIEYNQVTWNDVLFLTKIFQEEKILIEQGQPSLS